MNVFENVLEFKTPSFTPCDDCKEPYVKLLSRGGRGLCPDCAAKHQRAAGLSELRRNRESTLLRAGVPKRHARTPFEELEHWPKDPRTDQLDLAAWAGDPWSALLVGPTGPGKTMLAVELLFRWLCRPASGRFIRASRIPALYFGHEAAEVHELETTELLVLDDVGRGHLGRAWEAIGEILNARYDDEYTTIITSNLKLAEIAEHDPHLADRLSEGLVIRLDGESRRELRTGG